MRPQARALAPDGLLQGTFAPGRTSAYKLTLMKKLSQSSKPSKVKERVADLDLIQGLYHQLGPAIRTLALKPEGIRYYAYSVIRSKIFQIIRRDDPDRYLHVIAFVGHQFYRLQDNLVDVLLASLRTFQNGAIREHKEQCYVHREQRHEALKALLGTLEGGLVGTLSTIGAITDNRALSDVEKVTRIRALLATRETQRLLENDPVAEKADIGEVRGDGVEFFEPLRRPRHPCLVDQGEGDLVLTKQVGELRVEPISVADFEREAQLLRQSFQEGSESREKVRLGRERVFVEIGKLDQNRPKLFLEQTRPGYEFVEFGLAIDETPLVREDLGNLERKNEGRRGLDVPAAHGARRRRPVKRAVHLDGVKVRGVVAQILCGFHPFGIEASLPARRSKGRRANAQFCSMAHNLAIVSDSGCSRNAGAPGYRRQCPMPSRCSLFSGSSLVRHKHVFTKGKF